MKNNKLNNRLKALKMYDDLDDKVNVDKLVKKIADKLEDYENNKHL